MRLDENINYKNESEMFDQMANYYDRFRPGYPDEIIETFLDKAGICEGDNILEVGAGSGKATSQFCGKGLNFTCIEPGDNLCKIGNTRFPNENFNFVTSRFENLSNDDKRFDALFSAQAFHWVPKPDGYIKASELLKEKGCLALVWNMYITYDNDLDNELLKLSKRYGGFADFLSESECENRISRIVNEINNSDCFTRPEVYRVLWKKNYTPEEYFGFVMTGNRFVQKSDEEKEQARKDIFDLASRHGGFIERPYLCVLYLAKNKVKSKDFNYESGRSR